MRTKALLIFSIVFVSTTAAWSTPVRVTLTRKIKSVFHTKLEEDKLEIITSAPSEPVISIFGGDVAIDNVKFTIAVYDVNENGMYNDVNEDYLLIGEPGLDKLYVHRSVQTSNIRNANFVNVNNTCFRILKISARGDFVEIERCLAVDVINGALVLKLFNSMPDQNFELLNGQMSNLRNYLGQKKYVYIDIWGTWCPGCIQTLGELKKLHAKYKNQLTIIGLNFKDNDKARVSRFVKQHGIEWVNGFSTETINLELMQAAFPYGVLFNEKGDVVKIDVMPSDVASFMDSVTTRRAQDLRTR